MAPFVAADTNDVNVKHLTTLFMNVMDDLSSKPSKNKNDRIADILTSENFVHVVKKMLTHNVGLHNQNTKKMDEVMARLKAVEDREVAKDQIIATQAEELISVKKALVSTKLELEKTQQHVNRDTFKLCNVKEPQLAQGEFEDTQDTIIKALGTASVPIKKEEISSSFRVPSRPESGRTGPKNIIIKCALQDVKDKVMRNKKLLRSNEAFQKDYPEAFIVEQLTPLRSKVAFLLRQDTNVDKVWSINGRIKVVLAGAGNDRPKTIDSLAQLKLVPGWTEERIEKLVLEQ